MKLVISVGELSADEHCAPIISHLRELVPDLEVKGMGGRNLRQVGVDTVVDSESEASVMGFGELFGSLSKIYRAYRRMQSLLRTYRPAMLLVVDYAEFNMLLGSYASKLGIPVFYLITPQVWAWRRGRVRTLAKMLQGAVTLFPFEAKFLSEHGVKNAAFVGHPMVDKIPPGRASASERASILSAQGLDPARPVLAIFPGSRKGEITRHLEASLDAAIRLKSSAPEVQSVVALAPSLKGTSLGDDVQASGAASVFTGSSIDLLRCADAGLLKSGTSNLQAVFCELPFSMFYKATAVSAFIVRRFVEIRQYSIANVLKPNCVKESIQEELNGEDLAKDALDLLFNSARRERQIADFKEIRRSLTYEGSASSNLKQHSFHGRVAELLEQRLRTP